MKRILLAAAATITLALPALAHVTLEKPEATAGQSYKGVLRLGHGCDGSPTTSFSVDIPDALTGVRPMPKAGWQITTQTGADAAEGARRITWSGGRVLDSEYDEFTFVGQVKSSASGAIYLPVVQACEKGELRWTEVPNANQAKLNMPAPVLRIAAKQEAQAQSPIRVEQVWSRATPNTASVGAGYLRVTNTGSTPDRLLGGTADIADRLEVHEMAMDGTVMKMRQLADGLVLQPGQSVDLKPGGLHIMIMGLKGPLKEGASFNGVLKFEKAGNVPVTFNVLGMGAPGPAAGSKVPEMMDHSHHH